MIEDGDENGSQAYILPPRERKDGTMVFTKNENYVDSSYNKRQLK